MFLLTVTGGPYAGVVCAGSDKLLFSRGATGNQVRGFTGMLVDKNPGGGDNDFKPAHRVSD